MTEKTASDEKGPTHLTPASLLLVRRCEWLPLLTAFVYFFCLMASYYILRPVRDEMGIRGGVDQLQWLFTATFIVMLLAVPAFAALASRFRRQRLIPLVYGFFILCIAGFWLWLESGRSPTWAARSFFVWLSVFNLFVVSVFWSLMTDLFDRTQAARLFGVIAAGGSLGAIVGPLIAAALAQRIGPEGLLPLAGWILAATVPCVWLLERWHRQNSAGNGSQSGSISTDGSALGGSILEGLQSIVGSPYLLGICSFIWLYTTLSTFLYFAQADIVASTFGSSEDRTSVFAILDLVTNALTIGLQLFITARLVSRFGLDKALGLVPALVAIGFLALALAPVLMTIAVFQVVRRAGNYAISKPGREMLFTVLPRTQKYKAKNIIDTVVYRGGDAVAGWIYAGLAAVGLELSGIAWLSVPIALVWMTVGFWLGRAQAAMHLNTTEETQQ